MMRWRDQSGPTRLPRQRRPGAAETGQAAPRRVLVDSLRNSYQTTLVAGLADAALRRDVDLVVFAGGVLGAPGNPGVNRNFVFAACDRRRSTRRSSWAARSATTSGPARSRTTLRPPRPPAGRQHGGRPPRRPQPLVDEEAGMRQALEHLIGRHGFRRIAFVRGPSVNAEAERRYAVYRAVLEEHGIGLDPDSRLPGDVRANGGRSRGERC